MHHQVLVGVVHRCTDLAKERQAFGNAPLVFVAVGGDRRAGDVLHANEQSAAGLADVVGLDDLGQAADLHRRLGLDQIEYTIGIHVTAIQDGWLFSRWRDRTLCSAPRSA